MRRRALSLRRLLALFAMVVGAAGLSAAAVVATREAYTVYVDDAPMQVWGDFATVADVLAAADVTVGATDWVVPAPESAADPTTAVSVRRAKSVVVRTESGTQTYQTHQRTLGAFLNEAGIRVRRSDALLADGQQVAFQRVDAVAVPGVVEIGRFHTITIIDGGAEIVTRTAVETVGQALQEAGIILYAADGVEPSMGTWLTPDLRITIRRSKPLTIHVDGETIQTRSYRTNALDVLAEVGIGLIGYDYTRPGPEVTLQPGDTIEVVRVTEDFRLIDTPIPFDTVWQGTDQFDLDQSGLLIAGEPGIQRQRVRVRYDNGVEAGQTVDGEWTAKEPITQVMGYGTRITVRTLDTPEGPIEYWRVVRMRVTSYTAASSGKAPDHPYYGITASGVVAGKGVVAVDPRVVPFRSNVYVPGYGVAFVGDTGGGVKGRWIDLGFDEDNYESWWGYVDVYYLTPVPEPSAINYQIPTVLP